MESVAYSYHRDEALFPRLDELLWKGTNDATASAIVPFISRGLSAIKLDFGWKISPQTIQQVLDCLADRAVGLRTFDLETAIPAVSLEEVLVDCLGVWKGLQELKLPEFYQTEKIVSAAGALQKLTYWGIAPLYIATYTPTGERFTFQSQTYPSLTQLDFYASPDRASQLFGESKQAGALTAVTLSYHQPTSPSDVSVFLATLSQSSPHLKDVGLSLHASETAMFAAGPLTFDTFRPLLQCDLELFNVAHGRPVVFSAEEVAEMGKAWPNMKDLQVCDDPHMQILTSDNAPDGNEFAILRSFTQHLPGLETLCLYYDNEFDQAQLEEACSEDMPKSENLENLGVGLSPVPDDRLALGAFFANICSQSVKISYGTSYWYRGPKDEVDDEGAAWSEVQKAFDVVHRSIVLALGAAKPN